MLAFASDLITVPLTIPGIWRFYLWLLSFTLTSHESPSPEEQTTFTSLPVEVLSQILTHLDCHSVLEVRRTCKTLHSVTKSRQLWCNFIVGLERRHGISPPEEGCDKYTVDELEQWVLRRNRAQNVWTSTHPRFRPHGIDPCQGKPYIKPSDQKLVPGGRWLLVAYSSAVMYTLDLDDTNPAPRVLYDPGDFDRELSGQKVDTDCTLWVDRSKPRLSFRVAGCIRGEESPRRFIYDVELVGHGTGATLVAGPHALFRDSRPGWKHSLFALNDQYVVEVWDEPKESLGFNLNKEVRVYHYNDALVSAGHLEYSSIKPIVHQLQGVVCTLVEFIHGNMFAVYATSPYLLYLFEIFSHPDGSTPGDSIQLLRTVEMSYYHQSDIRLLSGMSESRLVTVEDSTEIKGVVIPHGKTIPPTIVELGRCSSDWDLTNCCALGISGSVFLDRVNNTYGIVTHEWNPALPVQSTPLLSHNETPRLPRRLVGFDEDTGRLVFLDRTRYHTMLIVDVV